MRSLVIALCVITAQLHWHWSHFPRTRTESLLHIERSGLHALQNRSGCFVRSTGLRDSGSFWPRFPSLYLQQNKPSLLSVVQLFPPLSTFFCDKSVVLNIVTEEFNHESNRFAYPETPPETWPFAPLCTFLWKSWMRSLQSSCMLYMSYLLWNYILMSDSN